MERTILVKDASGNMTSFQERLYMLQLRVDISNNFFLFHLLEFTTYLEKEFGYWLIGREVSPTGKDHLQCFVITPNAKVLSKKHTTRIRNYIKRKWSVKKDIKGHQPVSLTQAKFPDKLYNYCIKDGRHSTNIPDDMLPLIQDYANKLRETRKATQWKEILKIINTCKTHNEMIHKFAEKVKNKVWNAMPTKKVFWTALLIAQNISAYDYNNEFYRLNYINS